MHIDHHDPKTATIKLSKEQLDDLNEYCIQAFKNRAESCEFKVGTKKYLEAESHFFTGIMAALTAIGVDHSQAIRPNWAFAIMRGDSITK